MMASKQLKLCQYGENCYRKNPIHFGEYSHPHLDKIYERGLDPETKEYTIPDEYFMSSEVINQQLRLLEKLFPKKTQEQKVETNRSTNEQGHKLGNSLEATSRSRGTEKRSSSPQASTSKNASDRDASDSRNVFSKKTQPGSSSSVLDREQKVQTNRSTNEQGYKLGNSMEATGISRGTEKRSCSPQASTSKNASDGDASDSRKKPKITRNIKDYIPVVLPKGQMAKKLERAAPYNMFLTAITDCKVTHNEPLTVTLQEILDESLGEIESSVQINFMVDIGWLLGHYYFAGILDTPLLVLYGDETEELKTIHKHKPQCTAIKVNMPTPFSTSHTKMMLLGYKDGSMRVVISTANLYEDDWHNRTQGVWISPKMPAVPDDADTAFGESPTGFRQDLMLYLVEYKVAKLQPWIARIRKSDFSSVNVFFIGSVPGGFREGPRGFPWGHARLGTLLSKHATAIDEKIPVVCQSSSIGSLGANMEAWVQHDFLNSVRKDSQPLGLRKIPAFKMIYPSFGNVKNSHDGMLGGGCLPYSKNTNDKQPWLKSYLHQWRAKTRYRSQAMPHIKTYTRFNVDKKCVYWFVLTSANLSKAAWGAFNKNTNIQQCLRISNYEAGVLFLPRFVIGEETFPLDSIRDGIPAFPLPYDVPLQPYGLDDTPFLMDYLK